MRDFIILLVADVLADAYKHRLFACASLFIRALTLDDHERNTVDKEHHIGTACLFTASLLDNEFICDVIDVVFRMFPIDVMQAEAARIASDGLREAGAEGEQFIDFLIGAHETIVRLFLEITHGLLDIGFAERDFLPFVVDAVMLTQPLDQHILQNDIAELAASFGEGVIGREILIPHRHEQLQGGDL